MKDKKAAKKIIKLAKNNKKWLYYDGHSLEHKSAPVKSGIRYAVILFTKR